MMKNSVTINCLAYQISIARKKVQKFYEKHLEELGLNTSYVYVMEVIKDYGPCSLTSIAEHLQLERATVSNLLGRMERDGFIHRMPGKERRSMEVHLSEQGRKVLDRALNELSECDRILDDALGGKLDDLKGEIEKLNETI